VGTTADTLTMGSLSNGGMIREAGKGPLQGIVVLDFSNVVAGPMAAALLGELGAEVVKIDNMKLPDSARGLGNSPTRGMAGCMMQVGRGKQSICIDSRTVGGMEVVAGHAPPLTRVACSPRHHVRVFMEVIERLVKRADVLIQNFRPGGADSAGMGYEQCQALVRPRSNPLAF